MLNFKREEPLQSYIEERVRLRDRIRLYAYIRPLLRMPSLKSGSFISALRDSSKSIILGLILKNTNTKVAAETSKEMQLFKGFIQVPGYLIKSLQMVRVPSKTCPSFVSIFDIPLL